MDNVYIVSVHGIGNPFCHWVLRSRFEKHQISHLIFLYDYKSVTLKQAAEKLDKFIETFVPSGKRIILLGHSAGGRVILLSKHPRVIGHITIASPLQGSFFIKLFRGILVALYGPLIGDLGEPHGAKLTKPILTITASRFLNWDGRMFESTMHLESETWTEHLEKSWHSGRQVTDERTVNFILQYIPQFLEKETEFFKKMIY